MVPLRVDTTSSPYLPPSFCRTEVGVWKRASTTVGKEGLTVVWVGRSYFYWSRVCGERLGHTPRSGPSYVPLASDTETRGSGDQDTFFHFWKVSLHLRSGFSSVGGGGEGERTWLTSLRPSTPPHTRGWCLCVCCLVLCICVYGCVYSSMCGVLVCVSVCVYVRVCLSVVCDVCVSVYVRCVDVCLCVVYVCCVPYHYVWICVYVSCLCVVC